MYSSTLLAASGMPEWVMYVIIGVVLVGMIVLTIIPQKKRQKQQQEMMNSLVVGTKIMTIGRLVGKIVQINGDNTLHVNVGTEENPTIIVIDRNAVGLVLENIAPPAAPVVADAPVSEELKTEEVFTEEPAVEAPAVHRAFFLRCAGWDDKCRTAPPIPPGPRRSLCRYLRTSRGNFSVSLCGGSFVFADIEEGGEAFKKTPSTRAPVLLLPALFVMSAVSPFCLAAGEIHRDGSRDDPRQRGGEEVRKVEIRALETVRRREYEHGEQGEKHSRETAFHRAAARIAEAYQYACRHGYGFDDVVSDGERAVARSGQSHDHGEREHEDEGEKQCRHGRAQYVRKVSFEQFGIFHVKVYAVGKDI